MMGTVSKSYQVYVNRANTIAREVSLALFFLAFIGFVLLYVIDLPVRHSATDIQIGYYMNLPGWVSKIAGLTAITGLASFVFHSIKSNVRAILKITQHKAELNSKAGNLFIELDKLKRIVFIRKPYTFKPYRLEFVYPDQKVVRIKISSEEDFFEIANELYQATPDHVEMDKTLIESGD